LTTGSPASVAPATDHALVKLPTSAAVIVASPALLPDRRASKPDCNQHPGASSATAAASHLSLRQPLTTVSVMAPPNDGDFPER
jgi:hypothetical protein